MLRLTSKFKRMMEVYRIFGKGSVRDELLDFSDVAAIEMFEAETFGVWHYPPLSLRDGAYNGFEIGKHWMDVTLAMWRDDVANGLLFWIEIYNDKDFADVRWWLDKIHATMIPVPD